MKRKLQEIEKLEAQKTSLRKAKNIMLKEVAIDQAARYLRIDDGGLAGGPIRTGRAGWASCLFRCFPMAFRFDTGASNDRAGNSP